MIRLGGTASPSHMAVFQGLEAHFRLRGIELDWILYSGYDSLVEAFVSGEIELDWNGPLSYVKINRRLDTPCKVIAMRDVDIDFITHFITRAVSDVATVEDLKGKRFAFGSRGSVQAGLLAYHFLKQLGTHPRSDLAAYTFHDERQPSASSDEMDVIERPSEPTTSSSSAAPAAIFSRSCAAGRLGRCRRVRSPKCSGAVGTSTSAARTTRRRESSIAMGRS